MSRAQLDGQRKRARIARKFSVVGMEEMTGRMIREKRGKMGCEK